MREGEKTIEYRVLDALCEVFELRADWILGRRQSRRVNDARMVGYYVLRRYSDWSLDEIGEFFGRDGTTVCTRVARIELRLKNGEAALQGMVDRVLLLAGIAQEPCGAFATAMSRGRALDYVDAGDRRPYDVCARPECRLTRAEHDAARSMAEAA